jgi:hypothetical protein
MGVREGCMRERMGQRKCDGEDEPMTNPTIGPEAGLSTSWGNQEPSGLPKKLT